MTQRLFIVTGDPSGDVHAANLARALQAQDAAVEIAAVGGVMLQEAGVPLLADHREMARVGLWGFLSGIPSHIQLGRQILRFLQDFQPDAVLLIDYGGFNLRLAQHLKRAGYRVWYFIPPQIWASRRGRLKKLKSGVDHVFCIFPFEAEIYQKADIPVTYVGHPLVGSLPPPVDRPVFCAEHGLDPQRPIVALFPGSRRMEIDYLLAPILGALPRIVEQSPDVQFVLARSSAIAPQRFQQCLEAARQRTGCDTPVTLVEKQNHALLSVADAAIVASGTTTLEAALYGTPMVIIYKGHWFAYQLFKRLCYLPKIGLPNILTDMANPIAPELWQDAVTPERIAANLLPFLDAGSQESQQAQAGFQTIRETLGQHQGIATLAKEIESRLTHVGAGQ